MRIKLMNTPGLLLDFGVLSEDGSSLALLLEEDAGTCTLTFMLLVVESLVILTDGLTWVMSTLVSLRSTDLVSNWAGGGLFVSVAWSFPGLEILESTGTGGGASFGLPEAELGGVAGAVVLAADGAEVEPVREELDGLLTRGLQTKVGREGQVQELVRSHLHR